MTVRRTLLGLMAGLLALLAVGPVAAQQASATRVLVAGQDYTLLADPLPTEPGRIEVIYFFWYGSPWSAAFDPVVRGWANDRAPAMVRFQPAPAVIADRWGYGARVFFALEALHEERRISPLLFRALTAGLVDYQNPSSLRDWLKEQGVDLKAFSAALNDGKTLAKTAALPQIMGLYGVESVPTVVVQGRYVFAPNADGDPKELMERVEFAVQALAQRQAQAAAQAVGTSP